MNAKEKALLIFLILALGSAVVLNLSKRWRMSKEVLKILPLEEEVLAKENRDTQEFITEREEKVDINKAPLKELVSLPGIGPVLAERIIEYRERHKGFKRKEEIMKVKGIGRKKYERIRDKIKVEWGLGFHPQLDFSLIPQLGSLLASELNFPLIIQLFLLLFPRLDL